MEYQTVTEKIFAPKISDESLEELLKHLHPLSMIATRKMFQGPTRANIPLYVVTCRKSKYSERLRVRYSSYKVDTFRSVSFKMHQMQQKGTHQRELSRTDYLQ